MLLAPEEPEVARAQEGDHLVEDVRAVERIVQAEAREAQVDRERALEAVLAEIEEVGLVEDGCGDASRTTFTVTGRWNRNPRWNICIRNGPPDCARSAFSGRKRMSR
jgi:hypothetical protein